VPLGERFLEFWRHIIDRLTLKVKALQSFKLQGTTCPTTQCHIREEWNLQHQCYGTSNLAGHYVVW
jgi:hypothetical protein